MILAPTLSLNMPGGRRLDADAVAFAAASGATDVANLSAFVKGVKELGLWNSMVCWPMRSSQNAGSGNTVYSLGGLGTYNGTRVNEPAWGTSGIDFVAAADTHVTTGFKQAFNADKTWIVAAKFDAPTGAVVPRLIGDDQAAESELTLNIFASPDPANATGLNTWSGVGAVSSSRDINFTTTTWHEYGVSFDYANTTARYLFDGTTEDVLRVASLGSNSNANIGIGQFNNNNWDGLIAYVSRVSTAVSAGQMISLGNIAKQTLGADLGLP